MIENRCLVIFFVGEELTEDTRTGIVQAFVANNLNPVDITELDSKEIDACILAAAKNKEPKPAQIVQIHYTPEDEALIYIGKLFEKELNKFDATEFISTLSNKIMKCKIDPNAEESKAFMNALFILNKDELLVSQSLMKKYKLSHPRINLIQKIYRLAQSI